MPSITYTPTDGNLLDSFRNFLAIDTPNAKVGTFSLPTSTGNFTPVTGLSFEPTLVIIIGIQRPTPWIQNFRGASMHIGAATVDDQWAFGFWRADDADPRDHISKNDQVICGVFNGAIDMEASWVSMNSDGFTLNLTNVGLAAYMCSYLAIDLPGVAVGTTLSDTDTGNQALSGFGFAPTAFFSVHGLRTALSIDATKAIMGLGGADASEQYVAWGGSGPGDNYITSRYDNGDVITFADDATTAGGDGTIHSQASLASLDSDGVTLDWHTNDGTARYFHWIALQAGAVTRFLYPTNSPGGSFVQDTKVPARALIGFGNSQTVDDSWIDGASMGISLSTCTAGEEKSASFQIVDRGGPADIGRWARRDARDASFGCFQHRTDGAFPFVGDTGAHHNRCEITDCDHTVVESGQIFRYRFASR